MRTSRRVEQAYHLKSSSGHHAEGRGAGSAAAIPGSSLSTERAEGGRLSRAWRAVRGTGPVGAAAERCGASGWHLSSGCLDGDGGTICPLCGQRVPTVRRARVPRGVEVIEAHGA